MKARISLPPLIWPRYFGWRLPTNLDSKNLLLNEELGNTLTLFPAGFNHLKSMCNGVGGGAAHCGGGSGGGRQQT